MRIKKGDTVKVLKGKDVGKQGKVLKVLPEKEKLIVENVNVYKKHVKGDGRDKESAIVDVVKPIPVSNVMLVCQACGKQTRVGYERTKDGRVRICKKCGKDVTGSSTEKKETKAKSKTKKTTKKTNAKSTKSKKSK